MSRHTENARTPEYSRTEGARPEFTHPIFGRSENARTDFAHPIFPRQESPRPENAYATAYAERLSRIAIGDTRAFLGCLGSLKPGTGPSTVQDLLGKAVTLRKRGSIPEANKCVHNALLLRNCLERSRSDQERYLGRLAIGDVSVARDFASAAEKLQAYVRDRAATDGSATIGGGQEIPHSRADRHIGRPAEEIPRQPASVAEPLSTEDLRRETSDRHYSIQGSGPSARYRDQQPPDRGPAKFTECFIPGDDVHGAVIDAWAAEYLGQSATVRPGARPRDRTPGYMIRTSVVPSREIISVLLERSKARFRQDRSPKTLTSGRHTSPTERHGPLRQHSSSDIDEEMQRLQITCQVETEYKKSERALSPGKYLPLEVGVSNSVRRINVQGLLDGGLASSTKRFPDNLISLAFFRKIGGGNPPKQLVAPVDMGGIQKFKLSASGPVVLDLKWSGGVTRQLQFLVMTELVDELILGMTAIDKYKLWSIGQPQVGKTGGAVQYRRIMVGELQRRQLDYDTGSPTEFGGKTWYDRDSDSDGNPKPRPRIPKPDLEPGPRRPHPTPKRPSSPDPRTPLPPPPKPGRREL